MKILIDSRPYTQTHFAGRVMTQRSHSCKTLQETHPSRAMATLHAWLCTPHTNTTKTISSACEVTPKTYLVLRLAVFGVNGHELCVFSVLISRRLDNPVNHLPNTQTCDQRAEIHQVKDGKLVLLSSCQICECGCLHRIKQTI